MAGKITALVAQKRNKERVNVFIDGEFAFGLAMIEAIKLRKGQELSPADIANLKALDEIEVAQESALNFLSFRPRSAAEIRKNLLGKDYSEAAVEKVLERLSNAGLVNDAEFAQFWVENREQFKPLSSRGLRYELRQKGVPDDEIEGALEALDEEDSAYRAAREKALRIPTADKQLFSKKLGSFLARRGFSYNIVREVVDRLWIERIEDDETAYDNLDTDTFRED